MGAGAEMLHANLQRVQVEMLGSEAYQTFIRIKMPFQMEFNRFYYLKFI